VRLVAGDAPPTDEDRALFTEAELNAGWRLACRLRARAELTLELAQWETLILADESRFDFTPRDGLGIAVDVGTTTIVAQLVDLATAQVLGVRSAWNTQARHGADLMSRLEFAAHPDGAARLTRLLRHQVGTLVEGLLTHAPGPAPARVREIALVGNTVMHHLFSDLPVVSLGQHPFEPVDPGPRTFTAAELGWDPFLADGPTRLRFLPCLGSFVGSDILAGLLATRLHERTTPSALVDLGTNGEIVVGNRDRLVCASTAAGPAFEGARISRGMRAATGAISGVEFHAGTLQCHVLGGGTARGICGSGLVDAVAAGLELGWIRPSGRLTEGRPLPLADGVALSQADIREVQLAKGAIAAGLRLLARAWGTDLDHLEVVHLAGAFGNYINRASASRIGLLPVPAEHVRAAGNTALLGAKLALFHPPEDDGSFADLRRRIQHLPLNDDPGFIDTYVGEMAFPAA
jgi:uncharacterized 2Fe-2S/4Fe-4S cluster protein (DUF4445 family)